MCWTSTVSWNETLLVLIMVFLWLALRKMQNCEEVRFRWATLPRQSTMKNASLNSGIDNICHSCEENFSSTGLLSPSEWLFFTIRPSKISNDWPHRCPSNIFNILSPIRRSWAQHCSTNSMTTFYSSNVNRSNQNVFMPSLRLGLSWLSGFEDNVFIQ